MLTVKKSGLVFDGDLVASTSSDALIQQILDSSTKWTNTEKVVINNIALPADDLYRTHNLDGFYKSTQTKDSQCGVLSIITASIVCGYSELTFDIVDGGEVQGGNHDNTALLFGGMNVQITNNSWLFLWWAATSHIKSSLTTEQYNNLYTTKKEAREYLNNLKKTPDEFRSLGQNILDGLLSCTGSGYMLHNEPYVDILRNVIKYGKISDTEW